MSQYELPSPPGDKISAVVFAPNSPTRLLVSSLDRNIYLYDVANSGQLLDKFEWHCTILDICFGQNDDEAFVGTQEWEVMRYNSADSATSFGN